MNAFTSDAEQSPRNNQEYLLHGSIPTLTVIFSDNPMEIGERFSLTKSPINIGRSSKNDIVFRDDHPVSRKHVILSIENDACYLVQARTVEIDGSVRLPKYGAFINEKPMSDQYTLLHNKDEIRLGNRLRLLYEIPAQAQQQESTNEIFGTIECDNETQELL